MTTFVTQAKLSGNTLEHTIDPKGVMDGPLECTGPLQDLKGIIKNNATKEYKIVPTGRKDNGQETWAAIEKGRS